MFDSLEKVRLDTKSQRTITGIRGERAEYDALGRKLAEIEELENKLASDKNKYENRKGAGYTVNPYLKEDVAKELDAIQRRYNETLAAGRQRELDDAAAKNQKTAATRKAAEAVSALAHVNQGLISSYNRVAEAGSKANGITIQFQQQLGMYAGLYGLERILKSVVTIGGQFEFQHRALQNILGDVQQANTLYAQLQDLAVESPKTFMELTAYAKQLSAYQIPASELYDTTRRLADLSTGLGVDMSRLILAYGQVRSAAVLRGQELRQFTEAGIPMVQALADKFTQLNGRVTSTADVFKLISQRAVSFEMVRDVMWEMTDRGGRFYNMQNELADTLYGKYQKLQDSWQIMLGHIADGEGKIGAMLRWLIEGAVFLVNTIDSVVPLISAIGLGKAAGGLHQKIQSAYRIQTGDAAIRNMEIAKLKEANRLEKERIMNGRQLTAQEINLVATKSQLLSREYALLAQAGELNSKKTQQLINEGKISRYTIMRLALEQGITKEKIRQMSVTEAANAVGLFPGQDKKGGFGKGLVNFLGGPWGVAIAAIGAAWTAYEAIFSENEELARKGDAMMTHAQQNANSLAKALKTVEADGSTTKKIEVLEEALISVGSTGEAIVAKSRENMNDINKRWETLKQGADDYKKTLESMGSQEGKALFEKAIDDSDIEENISRYDNAVNKMTKQEGSLMRFEQIYKSAIASIISSNGKLAKSVEGKNLFEQIRIIGQKRLYDEIYVNRNNQYGALNSSAISSLNIYFNKIREVDKAWEKIATESIPNMGDALRAAAKKDGIENFDNLTPQQKQSLETLTREYVRAIENGSNDAKNMLAKELASQIFRIQIEADLTVDKTKMSSFAKYVWEKFGGIVAGDDGKINIGKKTFSKSQVSAVFGDVDTFAKQYNSEWQSLNGTVKKLNKAGATELAKTTEQDANDVKSVLDALGLFEDKSNKGGSKADEQLKRWKEEWGELKAFYSEFKKWAKEIGDDAALRKLRESGLWSQLFGADGKAKYDMTDWGKAIDEFKKRNGVNGSTTDRKKFVFELGKAKVDVEFDINKKVLERELSELQEYLSMQSERWNLFKSLFEKTGNRDFASLAFGDGQMWNDLSREFADELETMMTAAGKTLSTGVWSMTDAAAKEYFKEVSGGYDVWKKTVDLIRGEYKENLNAIAEAYSKVATEETKVAAAEARLAEARKRYGNDSAQAILAEKALNTVRAEAFEKSDLYTRFYSALFTMTISEAERAGEAIKKNLAKQLSEGTINADKYLKSIKNIDAQLDKMRNKKSGYELFKSGGFAGAAEQNVAIAEDAVSAAAERAERAEQAVLEARLKAANAVTDAEREAARLAILRARVEKTLSEEELQQAESQLKSAKQGLQLSTKANNTMNAISMVLGTWANMYKDFVNYAAEMGEDVEIAEGWDGMFGMFGSISNGINKFMSGDIGGGLMETVFGSALSFSKAHDKRMARDQKRSEEIVANLLAAMEIIEKSFERTLGSIYEYRATAEDLAELYHYIGRETPEEKARPTFGWGYKSKVRSDDTRAAIESALASGSYFDTELASLYVQRDELIRQMEDEQDKKDSDDDKIRDYKSQIAEIKDQIENFAEDMAKELWDIDVREWATQLGDALFEAWQQGESGAEAFKKKSSEIIAGLAKNIATQKLIEVAMKPVLDAVVSEMERTDGLLDATSTERIAAALATVGETLPTAFNTLMDGIEAGVQRSGLGSIKDTDGSSSGSSLIQGSFTENEISLLMAYMNGMRGDLSIQRSEVTAIRTLLQGQAGMPAIAQAQLQRLQIIAVNTGRNAGLVQDIYDLLRRLSPDGQRWKV